jgi:hypothetical protein
MRPAGFERKFAFEKLQKIHLTTGPYDFAVRKAGAFVVAPPTSTASLPASVTIAIRPFVGWDESSV